MKFEELKAYFEKFHLGEISKTELAFKIGKYQRAFNFDCGGYGK